MTIARKNQIDLAQTPYYHCVNRCVRRAFLCGEDSITGENYEHRREWIVTKLKALSSVFFIDICAYAIMHNHYHVILKVGKENAEHYSDKEVANRWIQFFKAPLLVSNWLKENEQTQAEKDKVAEIIATWRERLWDISWFMRILNESIARQANKEDNCKGRFWEGRFKTQALLDEAALLACMCYVDLNPIRAGIADTPETSEFTSIHERIALYSTEADDVEKNNPLKDKPLMSFNDKAPSKETIPFSYNDYLQLIDWSGRSILPDKRGSIPRAYPAILMRLGIRDKDWLSTVQYYEHHFPTVVGELKRMRAIAEKTGRCWIKGIKKSLYLGATESAGFGL